MFQGINDGTREKKKKNKPPVAPVKVEVGYWVKLLRKGCPGLVPV